MAFEVRGWEVEWGEEGCLWNFTLGTARLAVNGEETMNGTLGGLARAVGGELTVAMVRHDSNPHHGIRLIRKLTEKTAKALRLSLATLADELKEQKQIVEAFFCKAQLEEDLRSRIVGKCREWLLATWLSMPGTQFEAAIDRCLNSYIEDGKRLSGDFDILNEVYAVAVATRTPSLPLPDSVSLNPLVLVDINLNIEDKYFSEAFLWDPDNLDPTHIHSFTRELLSDIFAQHALEEDAFNKLQKQAKVQFRSQVLYKTLLKRYAAILLNFSTLQIPGETKEYLVSIDLHLNKQHGFEFHDQFQWDILNDSNDIEKFVTTLVQDCAIPQKYFTELCFKIRTQINAQLQWKLNLLARTFRSIHRDKQSPKLNTQTISILRRNVSYSMDVSLPAPDSYTPPSNIELNNSDLFSLLSRNIDILPTAFQEVLVGKEVPAPRDWQENLSPDQNPYLSGISNAYTLHNIWRKR